MTLAGIDESKATTLHLSKKQCCFFACYFIFFIVAGTSVSALLLIKVEANDVVPFSILIGLSAGMASGGTYYARKLYKAALDERLILEHDEMNAIINFGSMLYLVSRSVVAILLALVTVVALLATLVAVSLSG